MKLLPIFPGGRSHFSLNFWASLNPDLCCALKEKISSCRQWKLIRLGKCTHWSESSLGARHFVVLQLNHHVMQTTSSPVGKNRSPESQHAALHSNLFGVKSSNLNTVDKRQHFLHYKSIGKHFTAIYLVSEGRPTIYFEPWQKPRTRWDPAKPV